MNPVLELEVADITYISIGDRIKKKYEWRCKKSQQNWPQVWVKIL
jgi:hypothetical protein